MTFFSNWKQGNLPCGFIYALKSVRLKQRANPLQRLLKRGFWNRSTDSQCTPPSSNFFWLTSASLKKSSIYIKCNFRKTRSHQFSNTYIEHYPSENFQITFITLSLTFKNNRNNRIWFPKLSFRDISSRFHNHPKHCFQSWLNVDCYQRN